MALKGRRVLFISYNGMLDPLGRSQVIPYLRELSREGVHFKLLSFEREAAFEPAGVAKAETLRLQLAEHNIDWHWLRYHQKPSLPATAYDVLAGIRYASRLVRLNRIEMVHARAHIPATIALYLKKSFGIKMIFDVRGLMAEEYVDIGHWRKGGLPHRITKRTERRCFAASDGVVTLTSTIWPIIKEWDGLRGRKVAHEVIPCCADLEQFRLNLADRTLRRAELGLEDAFVLVYSGSIGGWYLTEEMADFFVALLKARPNAHFLWLTPGGHDRIDGMMQARGLKTEHYTVLRSASEDVASYLSASDAGIALIKRCFSKLASSPTKTPEYLACGLPVIINAGIGDSDHLITQEETGALVRGFNAEEYGRAANRILDMLADAEEARRHTRAVAERLFNLRGIGLERYMRLYNDVCS